MFATKQSSRNLGNNRGESTKRSAFNSGTQQTSAALLLDVNTTCAGSLASASMTVTEAASPMVKAAPFQEKSSSSLIVNEFGYTRPGISSGNSADTIAQYGISFVANFDAICVAVNQPMQASERSRERTLSNPNF